LAQVTASVSLFDNHIQNYIFQEQILDANGNPERVNPDGSPNPNGEYSKFTYVQSAARIDGGEFYLDIHPVSWLHFENALTLTYGTNLIGGGKAPDSLKYLPFMPPPHTHSELRATSAKGFGRIRNVPTPLSGLITTTRRTASSPPTARRPTPPAITCLAPASG
jgi:iron complex outermembrane receptor protein